MTTSIYLGKSPVGMELSVQNDLGAQLSKQGKPWNASEFPAIICLHIAFQATLSRAKMLQKFLLVVATCNYPFTHPQSADHKQLLHKNLEMK